MIAKENIYFENENKFNYSLISFENEDSSDSILSAIRDNFKRERLKAQYKGVREAIKMQSDSGEGYLIAPKDINYFLTEHSFPDEKFPVFWRDAISDQKLKIFKEQNNIQDVGSQFANVSFLRTQQHSKKTKKINLNGLKNG